MRIALIGYGKMGKAIERFAISRGHQIVSVIDINNQKDFDSEAFLSADVAIEFTTPATAVENYRRAFERGIPVVSGTTSWGDIEDIRPMIESNNATFFWSSNFSVGVNIFFAVNRYLSRIMDKFTQYRPSMLEIHHIHKLDHPSGTAKTLAEGIIEETSRIESWTENPSAADNELFIDHRREGEVPGTHIIGWDSPVDEIKIEHRAKSRDGFALGAVMAAEWSAGRKGILTMGQMMGDLLNCKE